MEQIHGPIHWTAQIGGIATELATHREHDLSVMAIGEGKVSWLVRRDGRDLVEGVEETAAAARAAAERHCTA